MRRLDQFAGGNDKQRQHLNDLVDESNEQKAEIEKLQALCKILLGMQRSQWDAWVSGVLCTFDQPSQLVLINA